MIPKANDIEASVLGLALRDDHACAVMLSELTAEDFTDSHCLIFYGIRQLFNDEAPVNPAALKNYIREQDLSDQVGGAGVADNLVESSKSAKPEGMDVACGYLKKYTKRRGLGDLCIDFSQRSKDPNEDTEQLIAEAGTAFFNLLADKDDDKESDLSDVLDEEIEKLTQPIEGGITTGLDLDKITKGFRPGNLVILAGKTSHGKSALADNFILHASKETSSAIASMEMTRSEIIERFLTNFCDVPYQAIRERKLTQEQFDKIKAGKEDLRAHKIKIIDKGSITIEHLHATARRLVLQQDIGLLVVDYLQQVISDGERRDLEVTKIVKVLKQIAQDLGIVVIALSQFSRKAGETQRPQLNHLKESSAIEQYANTAIILWNPSVDGKDYFPESDEKWGGKSTENIVELHVAKNRGGKTGTVKVGFDGDYQRFYNLAPEPESPKSAMDYL